MPDPDRKRRRDRSAGHPAVGKNRARAVERCLGGRARDGAERRQPLADNASAIAPQRGRRTALRGRRHATDCVLLAVKKLLRDRLPDLVLSGINGGSNVGEDLTYSG